MNITFSLDERLLAAAIVLAAKQNTSVNALVRTALEQQVAVGGAVSASESSGVLQVLLDYSIGRRPRAVTMQTLGIDDYGMLLRMLNAVGLPHPLVPLAKREAMAGELVEVLRSLKVMFMIHT